MTEKSQTPHFRNFALVAAAAAAALGLWIGLNAEYRQGFFNVITVMTGTDLQDMWDPATPDTPRTRVVSALVIDVDGDRMPLISASHSDMYLDFDNDGFAERVSWAFPPDGILVRDANGNGKVELPNELIAAPGENVFISLRHLDTNGDGALTAEDSTWASLFLWEPETPGTNLLRSLDERGITSISLADTPVNEAIEGNMILSRSVASISGQDRETQAVLLARQHNHAVFLPPVSKLPDFSGGGVTPPLSYSMMQDPDLLAAVQDLILRSKDLPPADFRAAVEAILWRWMGADSVVAGSRGPFIDARLPAIVEAYEASRFPVKRFRADQVAAVVERYDRIVDSFTDRFMVKSAPSYAALMGADAPGVNDHAYRYLAMHDIEPRENTLFTTDSKFVQAVLADLQRKGGDPVAGLKAAWNDVAFRNGLEFIRRHSTPDSSRYFLQEVQEQLPLKEARLAAAANVLAILMTGATPDDIGFGTSGPDIMELAPAMIGAFADDGEDFITGNGDPNILIGGKGNDRLAGGPGDDVYVWNRGDGSDVIADMELPEGASDDWLVLNHVVPEQVSATRDGDDVTLLIADSPAGAGGRLHLPGLGSGRSVETIFFVEKGVHQFDMRWSADDVLAKAKASPGAPAFTSEDPKNAPNAAQP